MILPEPEFVDAPERRLVALSGEFTLDTRTEIPALWQAFFAADWDLPGEREAAMYGASYSVQPDGRFTYAVGVPITPFPAGLPDGVCAVVLSAGRYAVFRARGPVRQIPQAFDAIFGTWLPGSGATQREGAVFERYPHDEGGSPESMAYEIWVPVAG